MVDAGIGEQIQNVRAQAAHLVAQLGADSSAAAPFLQALAALEQRVLFEQDTTPAEAIANTVMTPVATPCTSPENGIQDQLELARTAQHTAETEHQRLLRLLRQVPAAICTLEGPTHVFAFTNARFDLLVGHRQLVGQPARAVFPEVEGQGFFELLDQVYTTGVPFSGNEVSVQLNSQATGELEQIFLNFIFTPLRDASEHIIGVFVHAVDVTELVAARQQAEAAVVMRDQFLSIAAHELKTPLTSLIASIQLVQRRLRRSENVDDRTDRAITLVREQSQRLNRLVATLLDVARINMGLLSLELAPLDLGALTSRVVNEVSIAAEHRTIRISVPPEACVVQADDLRLEQVLVNLLQNALKYSPAGGDVDVIVQCAQPEARVVVRDTGIGIPAAALPHVFDRFYRVSEEVTRGIGGMGIGLSVVDEIVTLHGGTITVESTEGVGSIFTVSLPLSNH